METYLFFLKKNVNNLKNVENRFYLVYPIDNRCERDQTKDRIQRDSSQGGS